MLELVHFSPTKKRWEVCSARRRACPFLNEGQHKTKEDIYLAVRYQLEHSSLSIKDWREIEPLLVEASYNEMSKYILYNQQAHQRAVSSSQELQQLSVKTAKEKTDILLDMASSHSLNPEALDIAYASLLSYKKKFCIICTKNKSIVYKKEANFLFLSNEISFSDICKECEAKKPELSFSAQSRRISILAFVSTDSKRLWDSTITPEGHQKDHIIPLSLGGPHILSNQQFLISQENNMKSNNLDIKDIGVAILAEELGVFKISPHQKVIWNKLRQAFKSDIIHNDPSLLSQFKQALYDNNEYFYNSLNFLYNESKNTKSKKVVNEYLKYSSMRKEGLDSLFNRPAYSIDQKALSQITTLKGLINHFDKTAHSFLPLEPHNPIVLSS